MNPVVVKHKKTVNKAEHKARKKEVCEKCSANARDLGRELLACTKCLDAVYCSKECQVSDWKAKHKRECPDRERQLGLVLGDPRPLIASMYRSGLCPQQMVSSRNYTAPKGCKPNQTFWIKVETFGIGRHMLIGDQTK